MGLPKDFMDRGLKRAIKKAPARQIPHNSDWNYIELLPYVVVFGKGDGANYVCHISTFRKTYDREKALAVFPNAGRKGFVKNVLAVLKNLPEAEQVAAKYG